MPARPLQYSGLAVVWVVTECCWLGAFTDCFVGFIVSFILWLRAWGLLFLVALYYRFDGFKYFFLVVFFMLR